MLLASQLHGSLWTYLTSLVLLGAWLGEAAGLWRVCDHPARERDQEVSAGLHGTQTEEEKEDRGRREHDGGGSGWSEETGWRGQGECVWSMGFQDANIAVAYFMIPNNIAKNI